MDEGLKNWIMPLIGLAAGAVSPRAGSALQTMGSMVDRNIARKQMEEREAKSDERYQNSLDYRRERDSVMDQRHAESIAQRNQDRKEQGLARQSASILRKAREDRRQRERAEDLALSNQRYEDSRRIADDRHAIYMSDAARQQQAIAEQEHRRHTAKTNSLLNIQKSNPGLAYHATKAFEADDLELLTAMEHGAVTLDSDGKITATPTLGDLSKIGQDLDKAYGNISSITRKSQERYQKKVDKARQFGETLPPWSEEMLTPEEQDRITNLKEQVGLLRSRQQTAKTLMESSVGVNSDVMGLNGDEASLLKEHSWMGDMASGTLDPALQEAIKKKLNPEIDPRLATLGDWANSLLAAGERGRRFLKESGRPQRALEMDRRHR
jgi:hypothetical protein